MKLINYAMHLQLRRGLGRWVRRATGAVLRRDLSSKVDGVFDRPLIEVQQRACEVLFSAAFYVRTYPELCLAEEAAFDHYWSSGAKENRKPCFLFDGAYYARKNPDVVSSGLNPLAHFVLAGATEGRDPSALFDTSWYLRQNGDVRVNGGNPLAHYLTRGAVEQRDPNPLIDSAWYFARYSDAAASGQGALEHFVSRGAGEGYDPHPVFATSWYLTRNPDVAASGVNPLEHFLESGASEGRDPHPLFDLGYYLDRNPDVAESGINPLVHYLAAGGLEGRDAHPDFDSAYYLSAYPDVAEAGVNPLLHYLKSGAREGRNPSPRFDGAFYLRSNPDVAAAGQNPLVHFVTVGRREGRLPQPRSSELASVRGKTPMERLIGRYEEADEITAATLLRLREDRLYTTQDLFLPHLPVNAAVDHRLNSRPVLKILLPSVQMRHATGGPNTVYLLGCELARRGVDVAFVSTDLPPEDDLGPIKAHVSRLSGIDVDAWRVRFLDASDRERPFAIGVRDTFLATAWWTAHPAQAMAKLTQESRFIYLIQDYETMFYGASENYAQAEATYALNYIPVVNTNLLRDHLTDRGVGRFKSPFFADRSLVFEPAVDAEVFRPSTRDPARPRRLLFYARPTEAKRNLFGLGVAALRAAVQAGIFRSGAWEFLGMGDRFEPVPLGEMLTLQPTPWLDYAGYAEQMSGADVLLSLMLSPHPSYPPLEAAACGVVTVTTEFGSKTADRLRKLSPNIIGVPPTIDDLLLGLTRAIALSDARRHDQQRNTLNMPRTWTESFETVAPKLIDILRPSGCVQPTSWTPLPAPVSFVRSSPEIAGSPSFYAERAAMRRHEFREGSSARLLSLVTTVFDTSAQYLFDLASSVAAQDTQLDFEWLILDNGSSSADTLDALRAIGKNSRVRLGRLDRNAGIVGGMRWCLENAANRYILPLDSDDLLFPDCLRTITAFLEQTGYPSAVYTDEDKTHGDDQVSPYIKPDWDPVLFVHSCYIAHLTAIDRARALELDCYSDPEAEGCHDWDTFMRLLTAGETPLHCPEILYTWRMHKGSTSANHGSKPYIVGSHRFVLNRFLSDRGLAATHEIALAPLFGGTADYRIERRDKAAALSTADLVLPATITPDYLVSFCRQLPPGVDYVCLIDSGCSEISEFLHEEAEVLLAAFPDSVMVGGRLHNGQAIVEAGYVFGFGGVIGCPDVGRPLTDPGYFAQMWKPRSVAAVSARLAVVRREFLLDFAEKAHRQLTPGNLGIWLGAFARERGERIIYTPYAAARTQAGPFVITADEADDYRAAFGSFEADRVGYSHHLDLTGMCPYEPNLAAHAITLPPYAEYFRYRLARRLQRAAPLPSQAPTVSILTTVYERTDESLFLRTADSVSKQTQLPSEWIILAHGPISAELSSILSGLEMASFVTVHRLASNLGIQGGLRYCLERATGQFVLPLDADDLLTPDAVAVMTRAALIEPSASVFFSDEDILLDTELTSPVLRSRFDPLLLLSHSTIWHLVFFDREVGLRLGVYTDPETTYAQDWDTLVRFYFADHEPVHVPEILYHWRQHASSISNSGNTTFEGSTRSVLALLDRIRQSSTIADSLEVEPYPCDLGSPTHFLRRKAERAPAMGLIRFARDRHADLASPRFPFSSIEDMPPLRGPEGLAQLAALVARTRSDMILLLGGDVVSVDETGLWQAIKQLELVESCAAVGGVIAGRGGSIVSSASVQIGPSVLANPFHHMSIRDPGPLSLALLPHCVSAVCPDLLVIRRPWLEEALREAPDGTGLRSLGIWLGEFADRQGRLLGHEPLLRGYIENRIDLVGDDLSSLNRALRARGWLASARAIVGLRPYVEHKRLHS
jgi:glycosyltransferase involved in cell wall biosynthesis